MLTIHLKLVGLLILGLCVLNFFLPRRFNWKEELARLSLINRQIFLVHCAFIVLTCAMFGVLSLFFTGLLLEPTPLARLVLIGLTTFWTLRLFMQLFVYSPDLWRGKRFETAMHVVFTGMWAYFAAVYGTALMKQFAA